MLQRISRCQSQAVRYTFLSACSLLDAGSSDIGSQCCRLPVQPGLSYSRSLSTLSEARELSQLAPAQYNKVGHIDSRYFPSRPPVFAVVEIGPTQFKVSADDLVYAEKLKEVDINDKVSLNRVLMLGSRYETLIGRPFVPGASVTAVVEASPHALALTVLHFVLSWCPGRACGSNIGPCCSLFATSFEQDC